MLEAHRDMKPVQNRRIRNTRTAQDRSKAGTTIGERSQVSVTISAHCIKVSAYQYRDVGVALRDSTEYLPASAGRLNISDTNFEMALAIVAASDEGRVQTDADRRRRRCDPGRGHSAQLLANPQRTTAHCFGAGVGLDRQKIFQHADRDTIGHQSGKMRPHLIQFRCRSAIRRPTDAGLDPATANTEPSRKPHRHATEQRRDLLRPPVLDVTSSSTGRAIGPANRMIADLRGNHDLLNARQKQPDLEQRQPQIGDIAEAGRSMDLHQIDAPRGAVRSCFDQPQNPPHARSPPGNDPVGHIDSRPIPPISGQSPARVHIVERDHRELRREPAAYDRYLSVGVYGHAGFAYQPAWIESIATALKPGGIGMISTTDYMERSATEFLTLKYVFPGGNVPSLPRTLELLDRHGLHVVDVEELGWHYQRTAEHWLRNFEAHWTEMQAIDPSVFTERFRRVWNYYLCGVIEGFRPEGANLNLHHITFTKGKGHYPNVRDFIYVKR
jgi:hypothetical protein